jgi:hypothetical protein
MNAAAAGCGNTRLMNVQLFIRIRQLTSDDVNHVRYEAFHVVIILKCHFAPLA